MAGDHTTAVDIADPQRRVDLREALGRALNTWTDAPLWLVQLYDKLSKEIHDGQLEQPR